MNVKGVFSKQSDLWKTPSNIYKRFMENGYFDPCPANPTFDGLSIIWNKKNFVNPPYSQIMKWLDKAFAERERELFSLSHSSQNRHKMVCQNSSRKMHDHILTGKTKIQ